MQTEGKSYTDISKHTQTRDQPYKLLSFLQRQVISKLQDPSMANALMRVNETMNGLKRNQPINKHSWCPTEMIMHLLPSIHANSNY